MQYVFHRINPFNIDQQAQITSKQEEDALLKVFTKSLMTILDILVHNAMWLSLSDGLIAKEIQGFRKNLKLTGEFWSNEKIFFPKG